MKDIFKQQIDFQKFLGNNITTQEYKNQMFLGLIEETVEVMKETPVKKHSKNQHFNRENFLDECVDVQLYLFNLILSESSYTDFIHRVHKKQQINIQRQQNDY